MTPKSLEIGVLGLGNWGTALANHLACNGHDVLAWSRESSIVEGVNAHHRNPSYQSQIDLCEALLATDILSEVCRRKILVLVVPSQALTDLLPNVHVTSDTLLISGIKGLDTSTGLTPLQSAEKYMPTTPKMAVLSGPGFAKDVAAGQPSGLVAASVEKEAAQITAEIFTSSSMRVYTSTDVVGVELGGIVKNVIALAAGITDGLGLGDSARAGLITRGLAEMMRLADALGAQSRTLAGLSGLGDLVLTATCDASRNRTVGLRLGQGESLDYIVESLGSVAEGVRATPAVLALAERHSVEMPITKGVSLVLEGKVSPREMVHALITRPTKQEFEA